MEFKEKVKWERLEVNDEFVKELERRLVLCFSGRSRLSGRIIYEVMDRYEEVLDLLDEMKEIAYYMRDAIIKGDIDAFGELMNENWERQKRLTEGISDKQIERIFQLAKEGGAIGGKAMGAGGGGCILFLAKDDGVEELKNILGRRGIKLLPLRFVRKGVEIFEKVSN